MTVTRFVQFHQKIRHHKTDRSPFETPNDRVRHPGLILTHHCLLVTRQSFFLSALKKVFSANDAVS